MHKCNQPNLKNFAISTRKEKFFSSWYVNSFIRSFIQEELQLNHGKHKHLTPQVLFATLTHDDRIKFKPVDCLVKHETVLPSLKNDCHWGLAHSRNDQFPIRKDKEGERMLL